LQEEKDSKVKCKVPDEINPLEQDLQLFEQVAERSRDPHARKAFAQLARRIKYFQSREPLLREAAEQLGIQKMCEKLSSEELAYYVALPRDDGESKVRKMLREHFVEPCIGRLEKLRGWDREKVLTFCGMAFHHALSREYLLRRQKNEDENGRAVRQILVEDRKRGEMVTTLGREVARRLFFPHESPWESEEAPAEAISKLWERVNEFAKITPAAADPKTLQAFMDGTLNGIPQQARDHVRNRIETEVRRAQLLVQADSTHCQAEGQTVLVEMIRDKSRPEDEENRVLVEELLSMTELKAKDKELIKLCFCEGHTQEEAGALLGISQGQVSKRLTIILGALKRAAQNPTQIES
jgi:RNA polymerase sigma factor (sigma-70 family)